MDASEIAAFTQNGQSLLTALAQAQERLTTWATSFDQRGGEPVYGQDALNIVTFSNALDAALTPEMRAVIAQYRLDV